jgi:TetR/AcrR family transcriptional regulator, mexCD-oprJ operon repressor
VIARVPEQQTDHRRAVSERNLEAILRAAEALLARGEQPSITAVAAEAGVSRVTVYAHFPTLEALLEAVVERSVTRAAATIDAARPGDGPPLEALERVVSAGWDAVDRHSGMAHAAAEHLGAAAMERAHAAGYERIRALVKRGRREGAFRTDLPVEWLVTATFALIHACAEDVRSGKFSSTKGLAVLTATLRDLMTGPRG